MTLGEAFLQHDQEAGNLSGVETGLDQCPDCRCPLEIAAVKFSFLRGTAVLFVCPGCGLTRADPPKRVGIRDWVVILRRKLDRR